MAFDLDDWSAGLAKGLKDALRHLQVVAEEASDAVIDLAIAHARVEESLDSGGDGNLLNVGLGSAAFEMADADTSNVDGRDDHGCSGRYNASANVRAVKGRMLVAKERCTGPP